MLAQLSSEIEQFTETSKNYIPHMLTLLGAMWVFNFINWKTGARLNKFGIRPRRLIGIPGILFAPLLHGNFTHLLFNSVPLFFLALFAMSLDLVLFYWATLIVMLLSGIGVWSVGRRGIHIGASALIAGYFGYVLASAYEQPTFATFFCAGVALYYFGGILFSLFPTEEKTSWEGHLTGFLAGLAAMFICSHFKAHLYKAYYWLAGLLA